MFTGLIEEIGFLKSKKQKSNMLILNIQAKNILEGIKGGDSICVNGVCLTVTDFDKNSITIDLMKETIEKTNLKNIKGNEPLNLEKALSLNSLLGGHIVTGHIDDVGIIKSIKKEQNVFNLEIKTNSSVLDYLVDKGSVAVNGVSLTVGKIEKNSFWVYLILETIKKTNLNNLRVGSEVNLEADIIGKYIFKYASKYNKSKVDKDLLIRSGFLVKA